jgi:hypothetical protein
MSNANPGDRTGHRYIPLQPGPDKESDGSASIPARIESISLNVQLFKTQAKHIFPFRMKSFWMPGRIQPGLGELQVSPQ